MSVLWLGLLPWLLFALASVWRFLPHPVDPILFRQVRGATLLFLYLLPVVLYWRHCGWRLPTAAVAIPVIGVLSSFLLAVVPLTHEFAITLYLGSNVAIGGVFSWWVFKSAPKPRPLDSATALSALWLALIVRSLTLFGLGSGFDLTYLCVFPLLCGGRYFSIKRFVRAKM